MYGTSKVTPKSDHNKNHFEEQFEDSEMNQSAIGDYSRDQADYNEDG